MCITKRRPRVWLVFGVGEVPEPSDQPTVRDDRQHVWGPDDASGDYATTDGLHHATWFELRQTTDLTEVTE